MIASSGHWMCLLTTCLMLSITALGSSLLTTAVPDTIMLAPASATSPMVPGPTPPSTSISRSGYLERRVFTLGIMLDMNFWPPNPGST